MSTENDYNQTGFPQPPMSPQDGPPKMFWGMTENTYCMLMHLSQLLNYSGAGIVVPIVLWALNKDESPVIDQHGKNILNFVISMFIYLAISGILIFVVVGIFTAVAIVILMLVFPIIAAVKTSSGEY